MADCIITRRGGSNAGLYNFSIVGGNTQPAGKENMIWVDTSTKISAWAFAVNAPSSPIEGAIWIHTGDSSRVAFNALRENDIMIYPLTCNQYINNTWVTKTARTYQNNVWVDWVPAGAIFWDGYNPGSIVATGTQTNSSISFEDGYINVDMGSTSGLYMTSACTSSHVNLSAFSTLVIDAEVTNIGGQTYYSVFGISNTKISSPSFGDYLVRGRFSVGERKEIELDISGVSRGSVYVGWSGGLSAKIYKIYFK